MKIKICKTCNIYTLKDKCKKCGRDSTTPHPPKFSPRDPYGAYRRKMKKEFWEKNT